MHKNRSFNPLELENVFFDPAYKDIACDRIIKLDRKIAGIDDMLRATVYNRNLVIIKPTSASR